MNHLAAQQKLTLLLTLLTLYTSVKKSSKKWDRNWSLEEGVACWLVQLFNQGLPW